MAPVDKKRVFISYARSDGSAWADQVIELLSANDVSSWRDVSDMTAEHDNWPEVQQAIDDAQHLVLILTERALRSEWVKKEWSYARQEGVRVSPVLVADIEKKELPFWQRRGQLYDLNNPESRKLLVRVLESEGRVRKVPYDSGEEIEGFVPRPEEYNEIKQALLDHKGDPVVITAALKGAGGYGKTVLADALCRDEDIRFAFSDGVIRIVIGKETPDLINLMVDIIEKLKGERPGFKDSNVAAEELAKVIGDGHVLLVLDDVWHEQHLRPFLRANKKRTLLITTRIDEVLPRGAQRFDVDQLTPEQAVQVLSRDLSESLLPEEVESLEKLSKELGYWAQMLAIANRWLWNRINQRYLVGTAIQQFSARLAQKGYTAFDPHDEGARDRAVRLCIEVSLDDLSEDKQQRFQELAIFPEDEEIPLAMVQALWEATGQLDGLDSEDICIELKNRSLLQNYSGSNKMIKLHDIMLLYLKHRAGKDKLHDVQNTFLDSFARKLENDWSRVPAENHYLWKRLTWHLRQAGRKEEVERLLIEYEWIKGKLDANDVQSLYAEYLPEAESTGASLVGRALSLSLDSLSKHPAELPHQLWGRLAYDTVVDKAPEIENLLDCADEEQKRSVFYLKKPSLTPPGAELFRLTGHKDAVESAIFSPDGTRIVTASHDKTARIWDAISGQELHCLSGHEDMVLTSTFSPDGARIVTASIDQTARIWDVESGNCLLTLSGHEDMLLTATFSPDGTQIVTASYDQTTRIWDAISGQELHCLSGHEAWVNTAKFSPDGARIVNASIDHTASIWDVESGNCLLTLSGHEDVVNTAEFSPDGTRIVTASYDKTARIWDAVSGQELHCLSGHEDRVQTAVFSPDGTRIVTASFDKTTRIWDAISGQELHCLSGHENSVETAVFSPDGTRIVTCSQDKTARIWDV